MMEVKFEFELNRAWVFNEECEIVGETNFAVPAKWLKELYDEKYADKFDSLEELVDVYEPETDGEFIYQKAIEDGVLVEDMGIVMY